MPLFSEYKHSYWGIIFSGAATVPSPVARSRYLRFCWRLIYHLVTEVEDSQSAEVGSAEGDAPLISDAIVPCIKQLLHSNNLMSSAVGCILSLSSTALRTAGRLAAEILFLSESFNGYPGRNHGRLWLHSRISWIFFWRGCGPPSRLLILFSHFSFLFNWYIRYLKYSIYIKRVFSNTLSAKKNHNFLMLLAYLSVLSVTNSICALYCLS